MRIKEITLINFRSFNDMIQLNPNLNLRGAQSEASH